MKQKRPRTGTITKGWIGCAGLDGRYKEWLLSIPHAEAWRLHLHVYRLEILVNMTIWIFTITAIHIIIFAYYWSSSESIYSLRISVIVLSCWKAMVLSFRCWEAVSWIVSRFNGSWWLLKAFPKSASLDRLFSSDRLFLVRIKRCFFCADVSVIYFTSPYSIISSSSRATSSYPARVLGR